MPALSGRCRVALLAVFALLLQATIFAWHHHPLLPAASRDAGAALHGKTAPLAPLAAEEACEICQVLQHHSAAAGDSFALAAVPPVADRAHPNESQPVRGGSRAGFSARAPPQG